MHAADHQKIGLSRCMATVFLTAQIEINLKAPQKENKQPNGVHPDNGAPLSNKKKNRPTQGASEMVCQVK